MDERVDDNDDVSDVACHDKQRKRPYNLRSIAKGRQLLTAMKGETAVVRQRQSESIEAVRVFLQALG